MKLKYKKLIAFLVVLGTIELTWLNLGINTKIVHAANSPALSVIGQNINEKELQQKATTDTNKVWNIKFNWNIDYNSIKEHIQINEVNSGKLGRAIEATVLQEDNSSIKINPPSGGYKKGQMYQITIKKGAKPKAGNSLARDNIMKFSVNGENTAIAKVVNSSILTMFKAITINATTRSDVAKYKIEGNDTLFDIGETSINILENKSSVQVYFYGADGYRLLGTATLDVSKNTTDATIQIH